MVEFSKEEFELRKKKFLSAWKLLEPAINERRPLSANPEKIDEYKAKIVTTYNSLAKYIGSCAASAPSKRIEYIDLISGIKAKLLQAFEILNIQYEFGKSIFAEINLGNNLPTPSTSGVSVERSPQDQSSKSISSIGDLYENQKETTSSVQTDESTVSHSSELIDPVHTQSQRGVNQGEILNLSDSRENLNQNLDDHTEQQLQNVNAVNPQPIIPDETQILIPGLEIPRLLHNEPQNLIEQEQNTHTVMAQTQAEFLKLAATIMNHKFSGDALKLESFLTEVDLVETVASNENKNLCLTFIKTRLEGKALECLPENVISVEQIKTALSQTIKPEKSTVVEGRIMALRLDRGNFTKFTEQAEKLAEAFRRSLIIEGITKNKAQELTIAKTVELCRKTARSEIVKSVLSSGTFSEPADVLAKLVTENEIVRREKRETEASNATRQKFQNNKGQNFRQNNGRGRNFQDRGGNRFDNRNQNQQGNGQRNGFRGNFRQNANGNFNQNQNQNRGRNNNNNNNREHTVRIISGNAQDPSGGGQGQEQIVHIPMN